MADKVKPMRQDPVFALKRVSVFLEYALRHPTVDRRGVLSFQVPARPGGRVGTRLDNEPVYRIGPFLCPKPTGHLWHLQDLVKIAVFQQKLAQDLRSRT